MENTECFNIRWDDFEANTLVALKELRDETEFCDVTLACADGKQVSAHKVILAGGSKFFQQIFKQNPHPHPLLYLMGVRYEYLLSMLDFMYTGEATINQKELQSFLDVASDLQIKGLIDKNPPQKIFVKEGDMIRRNVSRQNERTDVKKEAGSVLCAKTSSQGNNPGSKSVCEEGTIDEPFGVNIKVELDDTIHSAASFGMEENREGLNRREDMMDFKTEVPNSYENSSIIKNEQMTPDSYGQSEVFSDNTLRTNLGKKIISPDKLFACQLQTSGPNNRNENYDHNQVLIDDNIKTKSCVTAGSYFNFEEDSYVETDDFLKGVDNEDQVFSDSNLTQRDPIDNVFKNQKNGHYMYKKGEKSDISVKHDAEPGESQHDEEFSKMTKKRKICSFCGKSFRDNSDLKCHIRIHTGEKPFPCLLCPKTFRKSSHLKSHTMLHTGEKPFQCLVCFKKFTQLSSLKAHKNAKKKCSMKLGE